MIKQDAVLVTQIQNHLMIIIHIIRINHLLKEESAEVGPGAPPEEEEEEELTGGLHLVS